MVNERERLEEALRISEARAKELEQQLNQLRTIAPTEVAMARNGVIHAINIILAHELGELRIQFEDQDDRSAVSVRNRIANIELAMLRLKKG